MVSVFLSGRPLWTNPEINSSDSFIAAWLPGSEGGGIAEMLFRSDLSYNFSENSHLVGHQKHIIRKK